MTRPLILLVEDNPAIRDAFAVLLLESGYAVSQAASGREALELAVTREPDLILMDLGLPDMNGLHVTRMLKGDPRTRGAAIIALTGRALETDRKACLAAGCSAYLAKPVNTSDLLQTIRGVLAARQTIVAIPGRE